MKLTLNSHKKLLEQQIFMIGLKINHCKKKSQKIALEHKLIDKKNEMGKLWRKYLLG